MFKKRLVVLSMMLGIILSLVTPLLSVYAQESVTNSGGRDISDRITELTIVDRDTKTDKKMYHDGDFISLTAKFAYSRGKIKGGDYIQIKWPTDSQRAMVYGFNGTQNLYINGVLVGKYTVNSTGARVDFDSSIDSLENVHGEFSFDLQLRNFSTKDEEITISSGQTIAVAKIERVSQNNNTDSLTSKQEWRSSKVGDLRSRRDDSNGNYIMWGIYLNSNRARLASDIIVEDTIPPSLKLNPDSINLSIDGGNQRKLSDVSPNIKVSINDSVLSVTLPKAEFSGKKLSLIYTTDVIDNGFKSFDNVAKIQYQLENEDVKSTVVTKTVKNVSFDAKVYGVRPNELKIIKKVKGEDKVIPGVAFVFLLQ